MKRGSIALIWLCSSLVVWAGDGSILKVLPHLVDKDGRHSTGPNLIDRDVYQKELRTHPEKVVSFRFDINWSGKGLKSEKARIRIEARSFKPGVDPIIIELPATSKGILSQWSGIAIDAETYKKFGLPESWRATLWEEDRLLSEQKSFLW
ncbi:MAG: hypothetical protein EXS24_04450 [Pedosphaera sp.]|nr:hypothetical protein [Pedosphaera sp.]